MVNRGTRTAFGPSLACCAWLLVAACTPAGPRDGPRAGDAVRWVGEQRQSVHGDVTAKVRLSDLDGTRGLCALGPLEGMQGEITVIDGRAVVSRVRDGAVQSETSPHAGAAFLVWIDAPAWREIALPDGVRDQDALEAFLPAALVAAGLDPARPSAFRLDGVAETLEFHVLDLPVGEAPGPEAHARAKRRFDARELGVRVLGFRSSAHRGVFTPPSSDLHMHFVSTDDGIAGHVEGFTLRKGSVLRLAGEPAGQR